jgi:MerR HTH family regulatory protein
MKTDKWILLQTVCTHYQVGLPFFNQLHDAGLIEIEIIEQIPYIAADQINSVDQMIRLHHDLEINLEGIDVVFNLLKKIEQLQKELLTTQNRLRLYES